MFCPPSSLGISRVLRPWPISSVNIATVVSLTRLKGAGRGAGAAEIFKLLGAESRETNMMQGDRGHRGATGHPHQPRVCHGHGIFQAEVCFLKTITQPGKLLHFGDAGKPKAIGHQNHCCHGCYVYHSQIVLVVVYYGIGSPTLLSLLYIFDPSEAYSNGFDQQWCQPGWSTPLRCWIAGDRFSRRWSLFSGASFNRRRFIIPGLTLSGHSLE